MKLLMFSNEILLENSRVMKLDYSLVEKSGEDNPEATYYGVSITKYLDNLVESDETGAISTSRDAVISVIKKLCKYEVTPISMVEIVDDMVTQGI